MTILAPALQRWLGAADSSDLDPWDDLDVTAPPLAVTGSAHVAVLHISGMPRALRPRIESLLVDHVPDGYAPLAPGLDPLTANWFTSWHRTAGPDAGIYVGCRQVVYGPAGNLRDLAKELTKISRHHGFDAEVREI
ncbi:MAG: hypothetical protein Q4G50_04050 [Corynebacterium sp.]|uniref:hypothetical protein n=1 Tax=Corynebacterium sp. TaxID=1720 RepID=UPI0026E0B65A|nr:hypothetical protein [Corynebacterium sp.]MDO5669154.1 hypothetical protein [Corynebacterium sp.]